MENETINDKLDKILSAKNDIKAALIEAGYDVSGGFATYGTAASSLTSAVDTCINELKGAVNKISGEVSSYSDAWKTGIDGSVSSLETSATALDSRTSSYSETWKNSIDSAASYTDASIDTIKGMLVLPRAISPAATDLSSWFTVNAQMKVHQQFSTVSGYGNYTAYKYIVDGGKTYRVRTGIGGSKTGIGLFLYDESLSTEYENSVSCLAYHISGYAILDFEFKTPTAEQKYVLGVFNNDPNNGLPIVSDKYPNECQYNLDRLGKDIYAPSKIEPAETLGGYWYSSSNGKSIAMGHASVVSSSPYSALKYVVNAGKTYSIHTNMRSQLAIGVFTLNDQLSTGNSNLLSVLVWRVASEPEQIYDLSVKIPDNYGKCVIGVSHADSATCRLSDVQAIDVYHVATTPAEIYTRLSAVEDEVMKLSADAAVNDVIHSYEDQCRLDELIEATPSAWTDGTFDKGKLVFMLDDSRTDVGYIASFLSSEYGFPMGFAVQYNRIGGDLIQSYIEDNGDGTSSTYNCQFTTVSSLLVAEEAFGGETWAHDCSKGRWMLSVDGEGLVPRFSEKMAEYYFIEIRRALQSLGLKVNGFVSPYHDPLDCYLPQMSKYFKYARYSTRNYPNLPYQIPLYSIASSTFEQKKQWIDSAIANKKLILFYGHGVGGDSQISMKDLKQMFDYVKEKVDGGVLDVTTVKALYAAQQN